MLYSSVPPINSREFLEGFIHHHLGLVLGAWCQPISCAGLGGSLGGEVCPEGSPGEVRLENGTLASWQGKVELRIWFFFNQLTVGGSSAKEDIAVNIVEGMVSEESVEGGQGEPARVGGGGVDLHLLHCLQEQHHGGGGQARDAWSPPVTNTTEGSQERTVSSALLLGMRRSNLMNTARCL